MGAPRLRTCEARLAAGFAALLVTFAVCAAPPVSSECLSCHAGKDPVVAAASLKGSIHQRLSCTDCHADITKIPHDKPAAVNCGACHQKELAGWRASFHAKSGGPSCVACHGSHQVPPPRSSDSLSSPERQVRLCGGCHAKLAGGEKWVRAFDTSVHGQGVTKLGLSVAPGCATCHGAHALRSLKTKDNASAKLKLAAMCGSCHEPVYRAYEKSIHAAALKQGIAAAPTCTDCHGEHGIQGSEATSSKVSPKAVPSTCGHCHSDKRLMANFGLPANMVSTFLKSYHGVALEMGDLRAADCSSCHGAHDILPSRDPASRTNPANLQKTCGRCHPGAGRNFAKIKFHESVSPKGARGAWFVRIFYIIFITVLVAGFLLHISVRLTGWLRARRSSKAGEDKDKR